MAARAPGRALPNQDLGVAAVACTDADGGGLHGSGDVVVLRP